MNQNDIDTRNYLGTEARLMKLLYPKHSHHDSEAPMREPFGGSQLAALEITIRDQQKDPAEDILSTHGGKPTG